MRKIDEAYEFIKKYISEKDYPPTIREIGDAINIKSTSTISYYLNRLEEENKIVKGNYKNRSIQLVENLGSKQDSNYIVMPCVKDVARGTSLTAESNIDTRYVFSGTLFKGLDMFILNVKDDGMKDKGILSGDMVVVSRQNVARNGETVVAFVNNKYMVAQLYREFGMFKLYQSNNEPIYADKVTILGKVVGVIRNDIK